jgi:hypothetical protein
MPAEHVNLRVDAAIGHAEHVESATFVGLGDNVDGNHATRGHERRAVRAFPHARLLRQGRDIRVGEPTCKRTQRAVAEHHGPIRPRLPGLPELRPLAHRQQRQQHRRDSHDADDRHQRCAEPRRDAAQSEGSERRSLCE